MKDGQIIEHGEKLEIFNHPKNPYTKQLVGFQNKIRKTKENKEKEILKITDD
jgi:ABC-type oligopeptide transport system ATPase subunit